MKKAEVARVVDGSLMEVKIRAPDNKRSIYRSVGAHVCIAKLELINPYGRIVVSSWSGELGACLVRDLQNRQKEAGEEQPLVHAGIQNTTLIIRLISSSNEKIVSRRGDKGAAVATARRDTSCSPKGTTRISRTMS